MSHELRTPLNSLLILSDQLSKNPDGNLTGKQTEFAKTIHSSGTDLLMLINDILDLSKIESGTVAVDIGELRLPDLENYVERTFRHVAEAKGVEFDLRFDAHLPASLHTDSKRLQQVIKNLLSNAFKFTPQKPAARKPLMPATLPLPPAAESEPAEPAKLVNEVGDDRESIQPGDATVLIVENDLAFARLMMESAREVGFKVLATSLGAA